MDNLLQIEIREWLVRPYSPALPYHARLCDRCAGQRKTEVRELELRDGTPMKHTSCERCGYRVG